MPKNTASPKRGASRRTPPPSNKSMPNWVSLFFSLVVGAGGMYGYQLFQHNQGAKDNTAEAQHPAKTGPAATKPTSKAPKYEFYTLLPESETVVSPQDVAQPDGKAAAEAKVSTNAKPATPEQPKQVVSAEQAKNIDAARAAAAISGQVPPPAPQVAQKTPPPSKPAALATPAPSRPAPTTAQDQDSATYYLQAGSFRRSQDADSVRARLASQGLQVRVESGNVRNETWYRVLVGPFTDRGKVAEAQGKLRAIGLSSLLIQQRKRS